MLTASKSPEANSIIRGNATAERPGLQEQHDHESHKPLLMLACVGEMGYFAACSAFLWLVMMSEHTLVSQEYIYIFACMHMHITTAQKASHADQHRYLYCTPAGFCQLLIIKQVTTYKY